MNVIYMKPGADSKVLNIENKLSVLQHYVEGYIESCPIAPDCCVICDEDGRCKELPATWSCSVNGHHIDFVGPLLIAGWNGVDFTDVPETFIRLCDRSK